MKTEIKRINKEIAQVLLENNISNRKLDKNHVSELTTFMKEGSFKSSGDPIRIAKNGRLLDGQHRLQAIVNSETEQDLVVVSDLEEEVFDVIDTGKIRGAHDFLHIMSVPSANIQSGIIKAVLSFEKGVDVTGGANKKKYAAGFKVVERYKSNPTYWDETSRFASNLYSKCKMLKPSEWGLLIHVFSRIDKACAIEFLEKLSNGVGLDTTDPILILRNKLMGYKMTPHLCVSVKMKLGLTFIAWNHYRKGSSLKLLRFNANSDNFPTLL